jgi:hypothetical protein
VPCIGVYRLDAHDSYTGKWVCGDCQNAGIDSRGKSIGTAYESIPPPGEESRTVLLSHSQFMNREQLYAS